MGIAIGIMVVSIVATIAGILLRNFTVALFGVIGIVIAPFLSQWIS